MKTPACFDDNQTRAIIKELCKKHNIDIDLLSDLCDKIEDFSGSGRKDGINSDITDCIDSFLNRSTHNRRG
jgi:hypothetical protein